MAGITPYQQEERLRPVTTAKQAGLSVGFGEGIGVAAVGTANALDAYTQRVEEAGVMELTAEFSDAARQVEQDYLRQQGRNAIDARPAADEAFDKLVADYSGRASSPRQRRMLQVQLNGRRERWAGSRDNHLNRETEAWQVGAEDGSLAAISRDAVAFPVGSVERTTSYLELGARLDDVGRRRGWSAEQRATAGFSLFSGVHVATVTQLQNERPDQAWEYLQEHQDAIEPTVYARLMPAVRDDRNSYVGREAIEGWHSEMERDNSVDVEVGGETRTEQMIAPLQGQPRRSSGFGPRVAPDLGGGRRGSSNHGGIDYAVAAGTPVVAALSGTVRVVNSGNQGYGTHVIIDHGSGRETLYGHLSAADVQDGARVEQGAVIGRVGSTGASSGNHLHFEDRINGQAVNPDDALGQNVTVGGGRRPAPQLATVEDVYDFAEEFAGDDWRLKEATIEQGLRRLQAGRNQRNDAWSEAAIQFDAWLADNPDATWDQAPTNLRTALGPSDRVSYRNRLTPRPESEGEDGNAARNDVFLGYIDRAGSDPENFASAEGIAQLRADRAVLGETKFMQLYRMASGVSTEQPAGSRTAPRVLQTIQPVVDGYINDVFGAAPEGGRPESQLRQIAAVQEGLLTWVEEYGRQNRDNPNPTLEQVRMQAVLLLQRTRGPDGTERVFADQRSPGAVYVIPDRIRRALERALREAGRPVNDQTLQEAYRRRLANPSAPTALSPISNGR